MPLKDWNLKSTWDEAYSLKAEAEWGHPNTRPGVRLHYHRSVMRPLADLRANELISVLGWSSPGPSIMIVGAGFGWTVEALEDLGFDRVVGIDISTYIHDNHNGTEEAEIDAEILAVGLDPTTGRGAQIKAKHFDGGSRGRSSRGVLNENGKNGGSRGRIKQSLGLHGNDRIDWVISESILESLTDAEALDASNTANNIGTNIVHVVFLTRPRQHQGYNWKTLEDWKALIPADTFVDAETYRVL